MTAVNIYIGCRNNICNNDDDNNNNENARETISHKNIGVELFA